MSGADLNSALSDKAKREATIREDNIAALRREHEAMSRHGKSDRAKLVEAELKALGADVKPAPVDAPAGVESAPAEPTRKRTQTRA